ncbi:MAG: hypothetical protein WCK25_06195 [Actinomycetes bacterium]
MEVLNLVMITLQTTKGGDQLATPFDGFVPHPPNHFGRGRLA